ncbi:T9SS type A sorting domain-containing protein [Candidatus Marinimicrobia bacterium]|nr:T9SS type A sorting domain-containing protein [Candidatus Neomarinimicrobiota bacterium]
MIIILFSLLLCFSTQLYAECSDLNYSECSEYPEYCEWNDESEVCQDIGGGGGSNDNYGPYEFTYLTESEGIQSSDLYNDATIYYPIDAIPPYKSVVLIDAFGSQPGLIDWAQFYASHGYIGMSIGNLDEFRRDSNSDWDYMDRAIALLGAVETIKLENERAISPLFNLIDTTNFAVSGYSTSGGGAHTALTIDSTLKTGILLNPAVAFLDSINCPAESDYYCLIEEHLDHNVPVLIFAGEGEYDELVTPGDDTYDSMWALPQYQHVPDDTDKLYFESANEGHGSSYIPSGIVGKQALFWLNYYMGNDTSYCDSLITQPDGVSSFLTTIICEQVIDSVESCILGEVYVSEGHNSGDPEDYIEIYNSGLNDCSLEGFQLDDNEELDDFTFGNIIIPASGYWIGYEDENNSFSSGLSANGDIIVFADSTGSSLIVELEVVQETDSISYSQSFDANGNGCYTIPTPGSLNGECVTLSTLQTAIPPREYSLSQNYPNPFNPTTQIRYDLPEDALVSISIYDVMGRKIKSLSNANQTAGYHSLQWDATNDIGEGVSAGMYIYTIQAGEYRSTKKMVLLK